MTNGEKIKAILKPREYQIKIYGDWVEIEIQCFGINFSCGLEWWNTEYKEPTTKTCRMCKNFGTHHGICEICKDNKCWTEKEPTIKNDVPENNVGNIYICSCGYGWDKSKVVRHHFCPNCGKAVASATKNDLGVDCISREQAIKQCGFGMTSLLIADNLRKLPPVAPQPIKGHWIPVFQGDEIIDYRCSCCEFGNTFGKGTVGMNYCPRCGSRNEVKQ